MKILSLLLFLLLANSVSAELFIYEHEYFGILTGMSSQDDVTAALGEPLRKSRSSNDVKFHYSDFQVTLQNDTGKVNTIIIFDREYLDQTGIRVGFSTTVLEAVFKAKVTDNYLIDPDKGIIYWFDKGRVSKIVLAYEMKLND